MAATNPGALASLAMMALGRGGAGAGAGGAGGQRPILAALAGRGGGINTRLMNFAALRGGPGPQNDAGGFTNLPTLVGSAGGAARLPDLQFGGTDTNLATALANLGLGGGGGGAGSARAQLLQSLLSGGGGGNQGGDIANALATLRNNQQAPTTAPTTAAPSTTTESSTEASSSSSSFQSLIDFALQNPEIVNSFLSSEGGSELLSSFLGGGGGAGGAAAAIGGGGGGEGGGNEVAQTPFGINLFPDEEFDVAGFDEADYDDEYGEYDGEDGRRRVFKSQNDLPHHFPPENSANYVINGADSPLEYPEYEQPSQEVVVDSGLNYQPLQPRQHRQPRKSWFGRIKTSIKSRWDDFRSRLPSFNVKSMFN